MRYEITKKNLNDISFLYIHGLCKDKVLTKKLCDAHFIYADLLTRHSENSGFTFLIYKLVLEKKQ